MSTRQMVTFVMVIVVAAIVGFAVGVIIGTPIASVVHEGAPVGVTSLSLLIGMLMAAFFGSLAYGLVKNYFER